MSLFQLLLYLLPIVGAGIALYPVIHSSYFIIFPIIIGGLLLAGIRCQKYSFFTISSVTMVLYYIIFINTLARPDFLYALIVGVTIYAILEIGYTYSLVDGSLLYNDRDHININEMLYKPLIWRVALVGFITFVSVFGMIYLASIVTVVFISPVIDIFILGVVLIYSFYLVYNHLISQEANKVK